MKKEMAREVFLSCFYKYFLFTLLQPPTMSPSHHAQQFPQPMPPPPYAVGRLSGSHRGVEYENPTPPPCPGAGPIAMTNGTIQLRLRDGIR